MNAIAMIYALNTNVILGLTEREYTSSLKVIFPIMIITFIMFTISYVLELYLFAITEKGENNGREIISSDKGQEECDVHESQGSDISGRRLSLYEECGIQFQIKW